MPVFYKIDTLHRLVTTIGTGVLTLNDCVDHQRGVAADPDFDPMFSQLMDLTQVTSVALTTEDVRQLARTVLFSQHSRRALLASSDEVFGMARMFGILRDTEGETGINVFRSRDEAMLWLQGLKE
jgi:hypothetical protein